MAAGANDKFTKSYSFLQKSLGATITDVATSLTLNNYTNIPTDTKVHFIIDRIDSNGNRTNSTRELASGICNGSAITSVSRGLHGTTAQSHDAGAVVEFVLSGAAWNDLIDGILAEHNQDGTHGAITTTSITNAGDISQTNGSAIDDDSGNELVKFAKTTSAVNEVSLGNASTGNAPYLSATGDDTNIDFAINAKGTGDLKVNGNPMGSGAWASWSPSYNGITVGNGTVVAKYIQLGKTVHAYFQLTLGSTSAISTSTQISLPVTATSNITTVRMPIGRVIAHDDTGNQYPGVVRLETTTTVRFLCDNAASTYSSIAGYSSTIPFTWTTNDMIAASFTYEAA